MAKPTTGHVEPVKEPDPEQMAEATLLTSIFAGISFVVAVIVYGCIGGVALKLFTGASRAVAMTAFGVALGLGFGFLAWVLRQNAEALKARNQNLYRGAWIGVVGALVVMVLMYFLPWIAFPKYCPPGALCQ